MPRLVHRLPKYRKHGKLAVVTLSGHDYYLGKYGTKASKAWYDRLCGEHLASGGVMVQNTGNDITIAQLLAGFLKHARKYYAGGTEAANYGPVIRRLRKAYGVIPAGEFGPLKLKAFRDSLVAEKLSRTSVNKATNRIRRIFKWGIENELVRPDVLAALKCVSGLRYGKSEAKETEPIKPVADWVVDATLPYFSPQVASMIQLQRVTGMRSGEVCRMRMADINTQGTTWTYTPARHKTLYRGHSRIVYLGPKAQEILKPWLRTDLEGNLFQPAEADAWRREQRHAKRTTPLSCGNRPGSHRTKNPRKKPGYGYTAQSYGRAINYAIDKCNRERAKRGEAEIPHWHPHQLRHNAATLYRKEYGLEVARVLLGHQTAAITEIYAQRDETRAIEAMSKIG